MYQHSTTPPPLTYLYSYPVSPPLLSPPPGTRVFVKMRTDFLHRGLCLIRTSPSVPVSQECYVIVASGHFVWRFTHRWMSMMKPTTSGVSLCSKYIYVLWYGKNEKAWSEIFLHFLFSFEALDTVLATQVPVRALPSSSALVSPLPTSQYSLEVALSPRCWFGANILRTFCKCH